MQDWLPGYERQIIIGAGLSVAPGRPKVVLHTTETGPGSLQFLVDHWRTNWGSGLPHFIVEGSRVVQMLPLTVGAYTLENAPGGADTNRSGPAVQAEIVSRAADDWDDATYIAVGRLLADIKRAGHDFDLGTYPRFYGANEGIVLAAYNSPIRMGAQEYIDFNGWTDHAHCPENAHWDIGRKDGARLERIARAHLDGTQPAPTPTATTEEDIMATKAELEQVVNAAADRVIGALRTSDNTFIATHQAENRVYLVLDGVKRHIPEAWMPAVLEKYFGAENRGVQDAALNALPTAEWADFPVASR